MRRVDKFYQVAPRFQDPFAADAHFRCVLGRLGPAVLQGSGESLASVGRRCAEGGDLALLNRQAEQQPPVLEQYSAWGVRQDHIRVSAAWQQLHRESAQLGLVARGYERERYGHLARLDQFCHMYLFYASSGMYSCPLAMTDGAARVLEVHGGPADLLERLTTRDPERFITSGQWMTERTGGSDVSNSETIAEAQSGSYALTGFKWFSSATTSEMAIALARTGEGGSRGLSCFVVRTHKPDGALNNIVVHRLKDKLGTKPVPTAELELQRTPAVLIGELNRGVPTISAQFNVTRWHNAIWCASAMSRALLLAKDHAAKRVVFGTPLVDNTLHTQVIADMDTETRGAVLLCAHASVLLGKDETGAATPEEQVILRMLTPLMKLFTGKQVMYVVSEAIEALGGVGYCEDSGLPQLLRDAQVTPVWEGTTNVLATDLWRPIVKENGLAVLLKDIRQRSDNHSALAAALDNLQEFALSAAKSNDVREAGARPFAFALTRAYVASLLLEHARHTGEALDELVARRWIDKIEHLTPQSAEDVRLAKLQSKL